jgi:hypothetical protein
MELILAANVDLDKNEDEKYTYINHFYWHPKINEK